MQGTIAIPGKPLTRGDRKHCGLPCRAHLADFACRM